jgi:hypothetical protein
VLAGALFVVHLAATIKKTKLQFTRPPRVPVQTAIRFRRVGDTEWLSGLTENISQTGVLFSAERVYRLNTAVEMRLDVPQPILGLTGPIKCDGCIVRAVVSTFGDNARLAAKILASEPMKLHAGGA